jgi:VWFA-related protein
MLARLIAAIAIATAPLLKIDAAAQAGEQAPAKIDAGLTARAEQVRVEVRVTDDDGHPVTNLQMSDFEIRDDGKAQDIVTFTLVNSESQASTAANLPAASDAPTRAGASGRAVVLVLDDLHIAASNTARVKDAVRAFIDRVVSAEDSVAVVFTSGGSGGGQDFTSDRRVVLGALDRFRGQKLRSATVERLQDPRLNLGGVVDPNADPNQLDRANRARISLDALRTIGDALAVFEDRRPMVLFVSEGPEYEVAEQSASNRSDQWSINNGIRDAARTLNRVNAVVFAIDPRGVAAGNADQIHASSVFETSGVGSSAIDRESRQALGVVHAITANTGGFTMSWRPNMSREFDRVVVADRSYYLIGYGAPSNNRGKYHDIAVRVRRRGVQARARSGYFLPAGNTVRPAPATP